MCRPELDRLEREFRNRALEIFGEAMTHDWSFIPGNGKFFKEWQRARSETIELITEAVRTAYRTTHPVKKRCSECGREKESGDGGE